MNYLRFRMRAVVRRTVRRLMVRIAGNAALRRELTNLDWLRDWAANEGVRVPRSLKPKKKKQGSG